MEVRRIRFRRLVIAAALVVSAGQPASAEEPGTLAVVGGSTITVERFEQEMARRGGNLPGQYATVEQRQALLDEMIEFEAQAEAAKRAGYDRDPDTLEMFKRLLVSRFRNGVLAERLETVEVTDEEVAAYYAEHAEEYARPERVQGAIVFIRVSPQAPSEKQIELRQRAELAHAEARTLDASVTHFGPVARKYSEDTASRYKGGVIGWVSPGRERAYKWEKGVLEALFALREPGEIGPIVETDGGLYLVRLVDHQESSVRPLEAVEQGLHARLLKEKRERVRAELMTALLDDLNVEVDRALLESIAPPTEAGDRLAGRTPPPLPGG